MAVRALIVGIDSYPAPVAALCGAGNDALAAERWLLDAGVPESGIRLLRDGAATRAAVIAGFEQHLSGAGAGDTALFWFAGHGSQQPVPPEYAHLEPSGLMQTVLCADSREPGGRDLADKEIRVLTSRLAERGAHVVLVMDCCHAESSSRLPGTGREKVRAIGRRADAPAGGLLPELADRADVAGLLKRTEGAEPNHVNLSACRYYQGARELRLDEPRGLFSLALTVELHRAGRAGSVPTYRELLVAARCYVENWMPDQQPVLYPDSSPAELADRPFLGGQAVPRPAPLTLSWRGGWEIDAGSCHGIAAAAECGETRVAVAERGPLREARVVEVRPDRSGVVPIGWQPDLSRQYPVVVSAVALPSATVVPTVNEEGNRAAVDLFTAAARTAGPGGGPSAHVRVAEAAGPPGSSWRLEVRAVRPGVVRLIDPERAESALPDLPCGTARQAAAAVEVAEHLARWRRIRALANPASELAGQIRLELVHAPAGQRRDHGDGAALRPGADGAIALDYAWTGADWEAPRVFLRLRSTSGHRLYCVLLDLTDDYEIATGLFDGDWIGPGRTAFVHDGTAIRMLLPQERPRRPGARATDWLKLLISPEPLSAQPFRMRPAGVPAAPRHRGTAGVRTLLESFGLDDGRRVARAEAIEAADWAAVTIPVSTGIPERTETQGDRISESYRSY
ncbi:caspase family protein [Actinospica sp.]|uniref:caspase family protein n=1 Tax=Actinospica sp. TaxID=1872142 RepID=UPI002D02A55D|nr:caspase family protein [Actinospica sp.]HWG28505.1 caspase family protein [Actinospica sp.]